MGEQCVMCGRVCECTVFKKNYKNMTSITYHGEHAIACYILVKKLKQRKRNAPRTPLNI